MNYSEKDFLGCRYNGLDKKFPSKYPQLFEIIPEGYEGDKEKLLRYLCLMYDPKSPLITDIASLETRKRTAAMYSELNEAESEKIFSLDDKYIIETIDVFLKEHINERLWYMIQGNEQTFYEYGKRLLQPVIDADAKEKDLLSAIAIKSKLSEDMASINVRLENDYRKLYIDDTVLQKASTKKRFNPESIATR